MTVYFSFSDAGDIIEMPIFLAGLIMCAGFFMMYLIEELVHLYINSRATTPQDMNIRRSFSLRKGTSEEPETPLSSNGVDKKNEHIHLMVEDDSVVSALRGLLIVLALSVHELFEGLAVGLESSVANVW